jgi:hypothetical protein
MNLRRSAAKRYRSLTTLALLLSGSLLPLLPALADQSSPPPGTLIENQATAAFTDAADGLSGTALSDKVSVTVAEVAGISAGSSGVSGTVYRTNRVFFDFIVKNEGNDPTQLFIPAAPSVATIDGVAFPAGSIGQLEVIGYNDGTTTTSITANNLVDITSGSVTSALSGVPNNGSVPAGGYIKVRVPVTVPFDAVTGKEISITLGNTAGQPANTNTPYVVGANGATGTGNDLYTEDNPGTSNGDTQGKPINGDAVNHRQEASSNQTATIVAPPTVTIKGTVIDDANNSALGTFSNIKDGTETGAKITPAIYAVLVDKDNKVVTTSVVADDGTYTLTTEGVQKGLRVILSTTQLSGTIPATTTGSLPTAWTNTSPLSDVLDLAIANVTGKDFGVDRLPVTLPVNTASQPNLPGDTKYQVPTLKATDAEDDPLGKLATIKTFKILTIPDVAQGTLFYNNVAVTAGQTISNYDPTKLTFDPVDGPVSMSFTYVAIDAAGKEDPNPASATMAFGATEIAISGTVYNDKDSSGKDGFDKIITPGEVGTDSVFGTSITPVNAVLTDKTGKILQTVQVNPNGTYSFAPIPASSEVIVILSRIPGTIGGTLARPVPPTGWVTTSPIKTAVITTGFLPVTQDFGIRQKAKLILVKRITKINGETTNPNDGTVLTGSTLDTYNFKSPLDPSVNGNWPANYIVGKVDAGLVKPGDKIEYTVYFQGSNATSVKLCDPIRGTQTYVPNSLTAKLGDNSTVAVSDGVNTYIGGQTPGDCNATSTTAAGADNGGVAIPLTTVPGATGVGAPETSYGLFRFTTQVTP